jgi:hypothetical protein
VSQVSSLLARRRLDRVHRTPYLHSTPIFKSLLLVNHTYQYKLQWSLHEVSSLEWKSNRLQQLHQLNKVIYVLTNSHMVNLGATHQVISLLAHGPTALWLLWLWLASDRPSVLLGTRVLLLCRCSPVGVLEDPWTIRGGYSKTIL